MADPSDRDLRTEIGEVVRALLEQKGLTQKRAAQLTRRRAEETGGQGLRREQIGRLSRGETSPSLAVIITFVNGLDMTLTEFAELLEQRLRASAETRSA